jgi:hypothetical protein
MSDICKAPFTGFVIGPRGEINYCCNGISEDYTICSIDEVENLQEFFSKSEKLNYVREQMLAGNCADINPCAGCFSNKNKFTFKNIINEKYPNEIKSTHIRFLEFTTSNLCNATCAMCDSRYSSSWVKYENAPSPVVKLSKTAIEKIVKILPGLDWMMIKGGEPFVDKNNFYILNKLFDINKSCQVSFVSNMSILEQEHIDTLKRNPSKVYINASVDGVGKVYDWIRSTKFENTVQNMERLYLDTGIKSSLAITLSIFNYFNLTDIFDYFSNKPYITWINCVNVLEGPIGCSIKCLPEKLFEEQKHKILTHSQLNKVTDLSLKKIKSLTSGKENKTSVFEHIHKINHMRGFDICDYVPELKAWRG